MKVLVVEDEALTRQTIVELLEDLFGKNIQLEQASSLSQMEKVCEFFSPQICILDLVLPDGNSLKKIPELIARFDCEVIVITGRSPESLRMALHYGAVDFIEKPFSWDRLKHSIENTAKLLEIKPPFVGVSGAATELRKKVLLAARSGVHLLVTGPTGSGKEVVADYYAYRRFLFSWEKKVIRINCAAIPPDLFEAELFGYRKGAFTGASSDKMGRIEMAQGGVLFLDEIAEIPDSVQAKLLRFMETGEYSVLGEVRQRTSNTIILGATAKPESLRKDIYHRFNVVVQIPPLSERKEDIPLLLEHFSQIFSVRYGVPAKMFSEEAVSFISSLELEGHIRELRNIVQNIYVYKPELEKVNPEDISEFISPVRERPDKAPEAGEFEFKKILNLPPREAKRAFERVYWKKQLEESRSLSELARKFNIAPSNLHRKLRKLGLL